MKRMPKVTIRLKKRVPKVLKKKQARARTIDKRLMKNS